MADIVLAAQTGRTTGSSASRRLRATGKVPAVVYGRGTEPRAVSVEWRELRSVLTTDQGVNALLTLDVGGRRTKAIVKELRNRARDVLLTQAIASEEEIESAEPADDLLQVDGMDKDLAQTLASRGIVTREDLAEQAIDDLTEIDGVDAERAGALIMAARKHWFDSAGQQA